MFWNYYILFIQEYLLFMTIYQNFHLTPSDKISRNNTLHFVNRALHYLSLFSRLVMSDSLRPHGLQHARPPCPSPSPRVCPSSCSLPVMTSSRLILWHSLLLLPSVFPSIRGFYRESAVCIRWPKEWSFSFSISPSNEYSGLISLKIDWFDLFAVQGTFRSLLQHQFESIHSFRRSTFFVV